MNYISKKILPCSTHTSPVLIPETMSLSSHSFTRYAGNQDAMGSKERAILLAFCVEQLKKLKATGQLKLNFKFSTSL